MTTFPPRVRFALGCLLATLLLTAALPMTMPTAQAASFIVVTPPGKVVMEVRETPFGTRLDIYAYNARFEDVTKALAEKCNVQITLQDQLGGGVVTIDRKNITPLQALSDICEQTGYLVDKLAGENYLIRATPFGGKLLVGNFDLAARATEDGVEINVRANQADVGAVLRAVAAKAGLKLMVADDATGKTSIRLAKATPENAIRQIAADANLAIGKMGDSIILIVRAPMVLVQSRVPLLPKLYVVPPARSTPSPTLPPDARSFDFNGQQFYHVPLQ